ncbi:MAG TPA: FHA domain-containing protein [Kofleriaceae bacterium]|nr:FHA domain-containing protein [Kofleriaceae bacterium]
MSVALTLRLVIRRGSGAKHTIDVGPGARIGRDPRADVRIPDEEVAPLACELERTENGWFVRALASDDRRPIAPGDELALGGVTIHVLAAPAGAAPSAERTASLARELVRELLAGPGGPELVVERGPASGKRLRLPPPDARVIVGRGEGATWVLLDPDLSRAHAAIDRSWDGVRVLDLGSKNGTRVAGALVPREGEGAGRAVADGDRIELGATAIRYSDPAEQYLRSLDDKLGRAPAIAAPPPAPAAFPWTALVAALIAAIAVAAILWILV